MCKTKAVNSSVALHVLYGSDSGKKFTGSLQMQYVWGLRISVERDVSKQKSEKYKCNPQNAINFSYCLTRSFFPHYPFQILFQLVQFCSTCY